MSNFKDEPVGLGGWLILPILGLIASPFIITHSLYNDFLPIFGDDYWLALTTPGTETYHYLWSPFLIFEILFNSIFALFSLFLLFLMFKKSHKLPKLIIIYYIANLLFVVSDFYLLNMIPVVAAQATDPAVIKEIVIALIGTLIWVPYFLVSTRVKNTFVPAHASYIMTRNREKYNDI